MSAPGLSLASVRLSNEKPLESFDYVRINPDKSATWFNRRPREAHENSQKNLDEKRGEYNGYMSRATKSKIKKMLRLWLSAMTVGLDHAKKTYGNRRKCDYYPRFITLTIPVKQMETDQEFKRKYLERFLQELKRTYKVRHYFWKAEPQKNGNIHFHLIVDRYIDKWAVQKVWCHIIKPYVEAYQAKQDDPTVLPPCTDIQQVKNFDRLAEYALKYCLKDETGEEKRPIKGRIWGASKALKDLKTLEAYHGEVSRHVFEAEAEAVQHYKLEHAETSEYFVHVVFHPAAWKQMRTTRLNLTNHIKKIYKQLYNGRTLDYEARIKKTVHRENYEYQRRIFTFDPVITAAGPYTLQ